MNRSRPQLRLIPGGAQANLPEMEGPIARLGLRRPTVPTRLWMFVILSKCALLISLLYFLLKK